jgi:hypothetical protein
MDNAKLRAWWFHRQGLDGSLAGASAGQVLERSGWARSVGGVGPYVTLFSRAAIGRAKADDAVRTLEIHELPAARGCTYVVPKSDFALALVVGRNFADAEIKTALKLGVTEKELARLRDSVVRALGDGPLAPDAIRDVVGKHARSLGPEGKKKGLSTTLPLALGPLQAMGVIRRISDNGRLDQQRYAYALWQPNPLDRSALSPDEAFIALARRYFSWVGPATPAEFQWFAGLGVKTAKAALDAIGLVPVEPGSDRLLLPEDADAFRRFKTPPKPIFALVSSLDAIQAHRRSLEGMLDPDDAQRKVWSEKGLTPVAGFADFPAHAILDRGRLIGLWEYDPETESIVAATFGVRDRALDAARKETERFVREELGDARSFSLDSPKSRAPKIAALRKSAA